MTDYFLFLDFETTDPVANMSCLLVKRHPNRTDILVKLDELNSTHQNRAAFLGAIWTLKWMVLEIDRDQLIQELDDLYSTHQSRAAYEGCDSALAWLSGDSDEDRFARELDGHSPDENPSNVDQVAESPSS